MSSFLPVAAKDGRIYCLVREYWLHYIGYNLDTRTCIFPVVGTYSICVFYCCVDVGVCWVISKQPFTKLCSDPAQALQMPPQTYLPTGMEGVITCPAASQPPLLRVDWTKDGKPLDLSMVLETLHSPFSACQQFGQNLFKCAQLEDKTITKWSKVTVDTLHLYFKQNYCFSLCLLLFQNNRIRSPRLFFDLHGIPVFHSIPTEETGTWKYCDVLSYNLLLCGPRVADCSEKIRGV